MNKSEACGPGIIDKTQRQTQQECIPDFPGVELFIYGLLAKREHTDHYGTYLVMSTGKKTAVRAINAHYVAFGRIAGDLAYGSGEHPWMETQKGFFPTLL